VSPLAQELFKTDGVTAVFLGNDFITVSKDPALDWDVLKAPLLTSIMDHYVSGKPVVVELAAKTPAETHGEADSDIVEQIKELIETRVRPAVAMDGGDIVYQDFREGVAAFLAKRQPVFR
jgi:hypothetical protein